MTINVHIERSRGTLGAVGIAVSIFTDAKIYLSTEPR